MRGQVQVGEHAQRPRPNGAWLDYEPGSDTIPPAPGLPPVSILTRPSTARRRGPWIAAVLAALYALLALAWTMTPS